MPVNKTDIINAGLFAIGAKKIFAPSDNTKAARLAESIYQFARDLVFDMGEKPNVTFTGFWTGGLITAAQNSIAKAYRRRRFKPGLLRKEIVNPQKGKGE